MKFQTSNFKCQILNKLNKELFDLEIRNWKLKIENLQDGQTLIEVVIALGIAVIVVTSMTIAVTSALSNATYSKNQSLATQYANEGMEIVRNVKTSNYATFSTLSGRYCLAQTCSTINTSVGTCGQNANGASLNCNANINNAVFIRQVDILPVGSALSKCTSSMQASVSVLWTDGKCAAGNYCHAVSDVSCFSDADVLQSP